LRPSSASLSCTYTIAFLHSACSQGFNDNEAVALIGAHSLGRAHLVPVSNGFLGTWTANPTRWTNDYFTGLLNRPWDPVTLSNGNMQFQR
jgi:catalase (peroxidase I)